MNNSCRDEEKKKTPIERYFSKAEKFLSRGMIDFQRWSRVFLALQPLFLDKLDNVRFQLGTC